ncbi:MAG: c-type cytochrome [Steroidobacteraceae bacterium]
MFLRCLRPSVLSASALAVIFLAFTAPAEAAGDAARGKTLGYTCLGCHGIESYKNAYPTFSVPRLRGQHAEYILAALQGYRSGERPHATMHAHASTLTDEQMQDVAAYLGGEPVKPAAGAAPVGQPPEQVATCSACHGRDGVGIVGIYPTLTGQHEDYLEHSLNEYRTGKRKNAIMAPFAAQLTEADVKVIARYFAQQKPALKTVPMREGK